MSKRTPGPWYDVNGNVYSHATKQHVVLCSNIADAKMIAAAPKMYELLKSFVELGPDPGGFWDDADRLLEEIDNEE